MDIHFGFLDIQILLNLPHAKLVTRSPYIISPSFLVGQISH